MHSLRGWGPCSSTEQRAQGASRHWAAGGGSHLLLQVELLIQSGCHAHSASRGKALPGACTRGGAQQGHKLVRRQLREGRRRWVGAGAATTRQRGPLKLCTHRRPQPPPASMQAPTRQPTFDPPRVAGSWRGGRRRHLAQVVLGCQAAAVPRVHKIVKGGPVFLCGLLAARQTASGSERAAGREGAVQAGRAPGWAGLAGAAGHLSAKAQRALPLPLQVLA